MIPQKKNVADPLLEPLVIKNRTFRNRIFSSAHACGLGQNGYPQETYQAYHEEKAKGGIGLSIFGGSSNVDIDSPDVFLQLNAGTDRIIPYFQQFSERMHAHNCALMCQITHLGRRGNPYSQDWVSAIAPTSMRETLHRGIPREMDEHDIDRVVKAYAAAAKRCYQGGLDGTETMASGHLIGQFMSPLTNRRTDKYGGSFENRMRFPLMVHEAMREAVGDDFILGMRLSIDEAFEGGLGPDECVQMGQILESEGLVDFFDAIHGTFDTWRNLSENIMPGMGNPIAPWIEKVGYFKREVKSPVIHATRVLDLASARFAVADGHVDLVGMTRSHIADPHIVNKIQQGEEHRIRPCVGATHCQGATRPHCLHNAASGRELNNMHTVTKAIVRRKAVVVGAGPGGLEAARVMALRGHDVSVFEAAPKAGGQLNIACQVDWRRDLVGIVDWRCMELEQMGVPIHYNHYLDAPDIVDMGADVVILATGGLPQVEFGEGSEHCISTWEILNREVKPGDKIMIFDGTGRHPALSATKVAFDEGSEVHLCTIDTSIGQELSNSESTKWRTMLSEMDIKPVCEHRPIKVKKASNRLEVELINDLTDSTHVLTVDQVIIEMGTIPMDGLFEELRASSSNNGVTDLHAMRDMLPQSGNGKGFELHRIGDAVSSRSVHSAIYDALRLCSVI